MSVVHRAAQPQILAAEAEVLNRALADLSLQLEQAVEIRAAAFKALKITK